MKIPSKSEIPFLLQRVALFVFVFFIILASLAQILLLIRTWTLLKAVQFGLLVVIFLVPIFLMFVSQSFWNSIEKFKTFSVLWVLAIAIGLRVVLIPLISTNFVSDMEDVHFLAVDISHGNPMANLDKYPNIPGATHLNMSALVLSFVYRLIGASTSSAKLFLIMLGGLTTFLVFLTGREIADTQAGFLAAFLFASLPSVICYTGVLAGDHLALPPMVLAVFIYASINKLDNNGKFSFLILLYAIIGVLVGLVDWFRPVGSILIVAYLLSVLIYGAGRWKFYKLLIILSVLLLAYTQTSQLAVKVSERIFQTNVLSSSQRVGEFLLKGLNPESKGIVTLEDDTIAGEAYQSFGDDNAGAQAYLIRVAISRLEHGQLWDLFKEKFNLIWSSHDALFDYSLAGSNDVELVNLMRSFETLLYLIITIFILFHAIISFRQRSHPAVFTMQLFILGFALLLLFMEVQNRYVMVVIPFSILLGTLGLKVAFSMMARSILPQDRFAP